MTLARSAILLLAAAVAPCATDVTAMRRLTHSQYNQTVHDLLGDQTNPANQFPQEDFVNGFKNQTPVSPDKPQTNRERMSAHATEQPCAGCHQFIDPIGFGLEKFDAIGGRREKLKLVFCNRHDDDDDKKVQTIELVLDNHGSVSGVPAGDFSSPKELGKILAARSECQECVVRQLFRYGWGRHELGADRPVIQSALERFRDSQFRFKELMISLIRAYAFAD